RVAGLACAYPGLQLGLHVVTSPGLPAAGQHDGGSGDLAEPLVGQRDDRRVRHLRMLAQGGGHRARIDLEAAADDDVVDAALDEHEPVPVDAREVVGPGPRARVRAGDLGGAGFQDAHLAGPEFAAVDGVDDAQLDAWMWPADAAALGVPPLPPVLHREP